MARVLHTDTDHREALTELDRLMEIDPESGTPDADELQLLALVIEDYEKERYPIGLPDPIEAIRFCMDQQGLRQRDLVPYFGSKRRVSDVLSGRRPLTLSMVRALHDGLARIHRSTPRESGSKEKTSALFPGWIFRAKPATHSARRRPPIPGQGGRPFRSEAGHFFGLRRNRWPASPGIGGRLPL
jgi:antitoxin component HigA of HigAB toxin-antitoxin module